MEDRLSRLESEVEKLSRSLKRLESRLDTLETSPQAPGSGAATVPGSPAPPVAGFEIASGITLFGRTLLVLGGGYFLRAMTDGGLLAPVGGVALGLLYALVWVVMADRAGAADRRLSAAFHGAAAILVAYPLLWETTVRFELLSPGVTAVCLSVVSLAAVMVAWRWQLRGFAWVSIVGAGLTSFALIAGTRELAPFTLFLMALSIATYWLAEHGDWPVVHWIAAVLADVAAAVVLVGALIERSAVSTNIAVAILAGLALAFVASFVFRVLRLHQSPGWFEIVQTGVVLVLGYGGSVWVAGPGPMGRTLTVFGIVAALAGYRLSVTSTSLPPKAREFLEGTSALTLLIACVGFFGAASLLASIAAVALSWLGGRLQRTPLSLQGALFVLAAAVTSGLVVQGGYAILAVADRPWPPIDLWWLLAFAAAAGAYALSQVGEAESLWQRWRVARLVILAVLVWGLGGAVLAGTAPLIAGRPGGDVSPALLATVRTAVLAGSSLALAALSRFERCREAAWLVYPVLLAGGIKLAIEDFPNGQSQTLFAALALYGTAVFFAPRLASRPNS